MIVFFFILWIIEIIFAIYYGYFVDSFWIGLFGCIIASFVNMSFIGFLLMDNKYSYLFKNNDHNPSKEDTNKDIRIVITFKKIDKDSDDDD